MSASTLVFLALAVFFWGASALFDKMALRSLGSQEVFVLRMGINALLSLLVFLGWWFPARAAILQSGKMPTISITISLTMTLAGVYFYIRALSGAEVSKVIPLTSSYPLVTFLLALAFMGEKFTWVKLAGTLLVCAGIGLLAL